MGREVISHVLDELSRISAERRAVDLATRDGGIDSHDACVLHNMLERRRQAAVAVARKPLYKPGERVRHVTRGDAEVMGVTYGDWSDSLPFYRIQQGDLHDLWPAEAIAGRALTDCGACQGGARGRDCTTCHGTGQVPEEVDAEGRLLP